MSYADGQAPLATLVAQTRRTPTVEVRCALSMTSPERSYRPGGDGKSGTAGVGMIDRWRREVLLHSERRRHA
jgi:hypothetical protein